jgi:hypothetical protein
MASAEVLQLVSLKCLYNVTAATADYSSGGKISVNGYTITVPNNLIVQFPAAWVPFKKLADGSFTGNGVSVNGNIVSFI